MAQQGIPMARQGHMAWKMDLVEEAVQGGAFFPNGDGVYCLVTSTPPPPFGCKI
jgi:hypothetical protein